MGLNSSNIFCINFGLFVLCFLIVYTHCFDILSCPPKCICSHSKDHDDRVKAKCGGGGDNVISSIEELRLKLYENLTDLINLDLSSNNLTYLPNKMFWLQDLQKLYLGKNHIEHIDDGAFLLLSSLKRLDLSNNKIRFITRPMLEGLVNLERLKLNQNYIRHIREGTFDGLLSLKQLDLSMNPLVCDCDLWWLSVWSMNMSVKLSPSTKCSEPIHLKDQPIKKFRSSVHCAWQDIAPVLELSPDRNQVVFEGDSLKMDCRSGIGNNIDDSKVMWYWAGLPPESVFSSTVHIENRHVILNPDTTIVERKLEIWQYRGQ